MKNCVFLLILFLSTNITSTLFREKTRDFLKEIKTIPQRNLGTEDEKKKLTGYLHSIKEMIKTEGNNLEPSEGKDENAESFKFDIPDKGCHVEGKINVQLKGIEITFVTPLNKSELKLTNIDPEVEKENIKTKYIKKFFEEVEKIIKGVDKVKEKIVSLIGDKDKDKDKKISFDGYEATAAKKDGDDKVIIITLKKDNVVELYQITITESEPDGIVNVNVKNIFFDTNFSLTIPTEGFLESQLIETLKDVHVHYERIKRLSSNSNTDTAEQDLNCDKINETLNENNRYKSEEFKLDGTSTKITMGLVEITYSCEEKDEFIHIKMEKDKMLKQMFVLKKSLYDLLPAVESFYDDVKENVYKTFIPESDDTFNIYGDKQPVVGNK